MSPSKSVAGLLAAMLCLSACGEVKREAPTGKGASAPAAEGMMVIRDEAGRDVVLPAKIRTVAVTNSYNAELVLAVAGAEPIVGIDSSTLDRVSYAPFKPNMIIAPNLGALNYERVADIRPDVVLIPRNGMWEQAVQQLEAFGIPVLVVTGWDPKYWDFNVRLVGKLFARPKRSEEILAFTDGIRALIAQRLKDVPPVTVYYEDRNPNQTAGINSGKTAFIASGGGRNIFGDVTTNGGLNIQTDPARVLQSDPDVIIKEAEEAYAGVPPADLARIGHDMAARPGWSGLKAIRNRRLVVYDAWPLNLAGWNLASLYAAKWLHPEQFGDVEPEAYAKRWAIRFLGAQYEGDARFVHTLESEK